MRRWEIKKGSHIGYHFIYDTENEAALALGRDTFVINNVVYFVDKLANVDRMVTTYGESQPDTFPHWTERQVREGDWVRTDDGRIVQVLKWQIMKSKKLPPNLEEPIPLCTVYVKLPFTAGSVYYKKDGSIVYKYVHADFFVKGAWNNPTRSSLGSNKDWISGIHNSRMSPDKRLYAYYLAVVGNPIKAYQLTYPGHYHNKLLFKQITRRAIKLFKDKNVLKELMTYMTLEDYRLKLEEGLKNSGLDMDFVFKEIKRGAEGAKAGTDDHQNMIKMSTEVIEKVLNAPIITRGASEMITQSTQDKKNGEIGLPLSPMLPIPNEAIADKVKQNTPELMDLIEANKQS